MFRHGNSARIVLCLYLPAAFQSALFSPLIDQQALGELSYSDAPRHMNAQVALAPFHTISPMHH